MTPVTRWHTQPYRSTFVKLPSTTMCMVERTARMYLLSNDEVISLLIQRGLESQDVEGGRRFERN